MDEGRIETGLALLRSGRSYKEASEITGVPEEVLMERMPPPGVHEPNRDFDDER